MAEIKILLLEDDAKDAELLEAALAAEDIQFDVTRVQTREAFTNAIDSVRFDIIFSDHSLPAFDGKTALDIAHRKCPDVPFIFVSGTIGEEGAVETLKRGATDYVLKHRLTRLVPAMQRALMETAERGKRQIAEAALQESEERHRPLFELNPMPMWVYDLETLRFLAVNDAALLRYGYSREEFLAMTLPEVHISQDFSESSQAAMARSGSSGGVWRHRTRDGGVILAEVWPHSLSFGRRQAQLILANDVTQQKSLEKEREQLLARLETEWNLFQAVLSQMPSGVTIAEAPSGKVILDNDQSRQIFGSDGHEDSDAGETGRFQGFHLDGKVYQHADWPLVRSVTSGESVRGEEIDCRHPDGTQVRIVVNSAPIKDRNGIVIAAVATAHDVTEQRQTEQLLHQSQKMEAVGRLAASVGHDFNNLLTVILGYCSLLLAEKPEGRDRNDDKLALETMQLAGQRAAALTRQLLAFSRKQVLQVRVVSLNDVVSESEKMLSRLLGKDVDLTTRLDPHLWLAKADPNQIDQVITNLVVNARDAMPRGGRITIETANVVLDEDYCQIHREVGPGQFVMLAVGDNGIGMDRVTLSHIFEPFFTLKELGKGTGIGLATVMGIVKHSRGSIRVSSEPGKGSTFKVYLPRTLEPARVLVETPAPASLQGTETILLVDHNAMVRRLTHDTLSSHGYTVIEAEGHDEALAKAEAHQGQLDLVLTDVVMSKASGREMVETLSAGRPAFKSIYMSGYASEALSKHMDMDREFCFLEKPFTTNELLRLVRETLESRR